jgi:copper chaperone CopZ
MAKIQGMLKKTPGVNASEVLFNTSRVKVELDESVVTSEQVQQRIETLGYAVLGVK